MRLILKKDDYMKDLLEVNLSLLIALIFMSENLLMLKLW